MIWKMYHNECNQITLSNKTTKYKDEIKWIIILFGIYCKENDTETQKK